VGDACATWRERQRGVADVDSTGRATGVEAITMTPDEPAPRVSAMASCAYCAWQAVLTDDTITDVAILLRKILIQHVKDEHPEHAAGRVLLFGKQVV
jgi:hypothetical protein